MKTSPNFDQQQFLTFLRQTYEIDFVSLSFIPEGECSYIYHAISSSDQYVVKVYIDPVVDLQHKMEISVKLRNFLPNVVAPILTNGGDWTCRFQADLSSYYLVALFPFIDGISRWQLWQKDQDFSGDQLRSVAQMIAHLHAITVDYPVIPKEDFTRPFCSGIQKIYQDINTFSPTHSYHQLLIDALKQEQSLVTSLISRFEDLVQYAQSGIKTTVITHGDPTSGNLVWNRGGIYLIDWDNMALGTPERDLTTFTGERFDLFLSVYLRHFQTDTLDLKLFSYYIHEWVLQEIYEFSERMLKSNNENQLQHDWQELRQYLPPDFSNLDSRIEAIQRELERGH